jgi:hypothetical protein
MNTEQQQQQQIADRAQRIERVNKRLNEHLSIKYLFLHAVALAFIGISYLYIQIILIFVSKSINQPALIVRIGSGVFCILCTFFTGILSKVLLFVYFLIIQASNLNLLLII